MNTIRIGEKEYFSINLFMLKNNLKSRASVYALLKEGKAIKKKIGSNSFFAANM